MLTKISIYTLVLSLSLALMPLTGFTQLPTSNIYHFNMVKVGKSYKIKSPKFITGFNKEGYNNQPSYFDDKEIYFSTNYYDSENTEIAKFDFFEKSLTRITYTPEKEYSPTLVPEKESFSVIRVENDENNTQTLSLYPLDGIGYAKRYMNSTNNIGYHTWLDASTLALFLVEEPHHNLAIADARSERRKIVIDKVGRCLKMAEPNKLLFVHKQAADQWYIKSYNTETNQSTVIVETLANAEDFEILNDGSILMAKKSKLFVFNKKNNSSWVELADFKDLGIKNIKRIASRKNSLVVVDESI